MVGSDLLYRCRHLGPGHPEVAGLILDNPSSLTVLVEPLGTRGEPVGFVRLYGIRLTSAIAFLETAVARRGWGVEASRLLVAYAMDALGLHRIEAKVYRYNTPSINALTRNSFQQEGVLRDALPPRREALRHPRLFHPGRRGATSAAAGAVPLHGLLGAGGVSVHTPRGGTWFDAARMSTTVSPWTTVVGFRTLISPFIPIR